MNKIAILIIAAAAATVAGAAPTANRARRAQPAAEEGAVSTKEGPVVVIDQYPKLGRQATLGAPSISGESTVGQCYTGKPRKWIVLESKYSTNARCVEQLTFTWHVLLETKSATNKDKEGQAKLAPYSYFTQTVTYSNIPRGSHAASVCLHPSYLERFGEPKAVGLVVSTQEGEVAGDSFSEIKGIAAHTKFWDDQKIMGAQMDGEPMIERRQGLQDRSKTIWALVNPNDYEMVAQ